MASAAEFTLTVDYDKFTVNNFREYRHQQRLCRNLRRGCVPRIILTEHEMTPYLITKVEEDENFRQQLIDGIESKLRNYEGEFQQIPELSQAMDKFQDQAWFEDHPSLLSFLCLPTPEITFIDLSDPKIVTSLQKCYRYKVTGIYSDLLNDYKADILKRLSRDVLNIAIGKVSFNFFAHHINVIFTTWSKNTPESMSRDSMRFLFDLLSFGEYDTFTMFLRKAMELKTYDIVGDAVEGLILHRDFNFFRQIIEHFGTGILNYGDIGSKLKMTCKPIYDYILASNVVVSRNFNHHDLATPLATGDAQMFQTILSTIDNPELDNSLMYHASNSGSPELYSQVREIFSHVSFNLKEITEYCVQENCIDLALFLINHDADKEQFRKLFKKALSDHPSDRRCMIEMLRL